MCVYACVDVSRDASVQVPDVKVTDNTRPKCQGHENEAA